MQIDWTSLSEGFYAELEKSAALPSGVVSAAKKAIPKALGTAAGLGAGWAGLRKLKNTAGEAVSGVLDSAKQFLPLGLSLLGGFRGGGMNATHPAASASPIGYKPNILMHDPTDVRSFTNPNVGYLKTADISDLVTKSLQQRAINNVIDSVMRPAQPALSTNSPEEAQKIEIVSKHPELATILKDEKNKAYLEKLLKETTK